MVRWTVFAVGLAAVGCGFTAKSDNPQQDAADVDAPDGAVVCTPAFPYTPSNFTPCTSEPLAPDLVIGTDTTFDPVTGQLVGNSTTSTLMTTGTSIKVVSVTGLTIDEGATLRILGNLPLIISVHGAASISGTLTASALGVTPGPGAGACAGMKGADADGGLTKSAGGGAAGGGYGSIGAPGGTGDTSGTPTLGGIQMATEGTPTVIPLRGGCAGGAGGEEHPTAVATPGLGGGGGGAIQLSVRDALEITATARIASNGGGGVRATNTSNASGTHAGAGGGGGGSGGAIFLEAGTMSILSNARLCANGGGGGGGSHDTTDGTSGADGQCARAAAVGGQGNGEAGDGAFGASNILVTDATFGSPGGGADGGGGGGGGGVGRIRVRAVMGTPPSGFLSSPPATTN